MDMSVYGISNTNQYKYLSLVFDKMSISGFCVPSKKNGQTVKVEFSNFLTTSKLKPSKVESDQEK